MAISQLEKIVFGGGCFWCTEAIFKLVRGVVSATPGYAGGTKQNPAYEEVSSGKTGHAEVIRVEYDPQKVTFKDLLTVFFATHDPTTPNRQGQDRGPQYRSAILYTTESEKEEAERFIKEMNSSQSNGDQVVTEVKPLKTFYEAEQYHRDYYEKNPHKPYCQVIINPKLAKVKKRFAKLLKDNEK